MVDVGDDGDVADVFPNRHPSRVAAASLPLPVTTEIAETFVPVATVRRRTSVVSQFVTLLAVLVPPIDLLSAMGLLWGVAFHWVDLIRLVTLYTVCAFGTTIGFHRYFTHRGFETSPVLKATLAILGCMTMQGPLTQWVTDHRKHHALSDKRAIRTRPMPATPTAFSARSADSSTPTLAGSSR